MRRFLPLALCLLLLSGCAPAETRAPAAVSSPPGFPAVYSLSAQLDAFRGEELTSRLCFEAVQTPQGFYYAASTGERYLFLLEGPDAYALYIWDRGGRLTPNGDTVLTRQALAGFQNTLLDLGLLERGAGELLPAGNATVAGRSCQVYAAGEDGLRQTCSVDRETGLALAHTAQYAGPGGETYTYQFICQRFATEGVQLPAAAAIP